MKSLQALDIALLQWLYTRKFYDTALIKLLIFIGDGPFWMLVLLASALLGQFFSLLVFEQLAWLLMLGLALGNLLFTPMKIKIKRRRPYANPELHKRMQLTIVNRDPGHGSKALESFPSGHAYWTALCVIIICYQLAWPAVLLLGWLIPLMIVLRPYLGVHYPSDTLVGFVLGCLIAALVTASHGLIWSGVETLKQVAGSAYVYGYWIFIAGYLRFGFKSWLKRV